MRFIRINTVVAHHANLSQRRTAMEGLKMWPHICLEMLLHSCWARAESPKTIQLKFIADPGDNPNCAVYRTWLKNWCGGLGDP